MSIVSVSVLLVIFLMFTWFKAYFYKELGRYADKHGKYEEASKYYQLAYKYYGDQELDKLEIQELLFRVSEKQDNIFVLNISQTSYFPNPSSIILFSEIMNIGLSFFPNEGIIIELAKQKKSLNKDSFSSYWECDSKCSIDDPNKNRITYHAPKKKDYIGLQSIY
ncbi:MAG: hypothetical protein HC887_05145 [Desulfobacteraceae bacterium]|nr:hypothetical protein [Desulfobacteraceae bacterium]